MADEAGFAGFHLAEHHGSDLCMAPNQEVFIAAASQVTKNIRLGPMVKLLPLHSPGADHRGHVRRRPPHRRPARLRRRSRRRPDRALLVRQQLAGVEGAVRRRRSGSSATRSRTGEISSENSQFYDFPTIPLSTKPFQDPIPFWYPGSPVTAGRHGMNLMWPGPINQEAYDLYVETWHAHKGDTIRLDGPDDEPRVGCTMLLAIAPTENEALDIAQRGMDGLIRRTRDVHRFDHLMLPPDECEAALGPLRAIIAHMDIAVQFGAGTPGQIAERVAMLLDDGMCDYICFMFPAGDMTFAESRRTLELFVTEVQPQLEQQTTTTR